MIERLAVDHPDVFDVYARFARQNHGALIRSAFNWEEYWRFETRKNGLLLSIMVPIKNL